jgi:hypothetical protein
MMSASSTLIKKKKAGSVAKQSKKGLVNQTSFIRALGAAAGAKHKKRATVSAYAEIEHLMDYALANFTFNGGEVLKYTGGETFGLKTAYTAVQTALTGELAKIAIDAGKTACKTFALAEGNDPPSFPDDPPPPLEAVAA